MYSKVGECSVCGTTIYSPLRIQKKNTGYIPLYFDCDCVIKRELLPDMLRIKSVGKIDKKLLFKVN